MLLTGMVAIVPTCDNDKLDSEGGLRLLSGKALEESAGPDCCTDEDDCNWSNDGTCDCSGKYDWDKQDCERVQEDLLVEDVEKSGACVEGESGGIFYVRIADGPENNTLTGDCGGGNPGADIDAVVLIRPDGTEFYALSVEEDSDVLGQVCHANDKDDVNSVLGQPDACAKENGSGCGDNGYPENYNCECAGGSSEWAGYFSLNGGAIIVSFENDTELLCGDKVIVYEMYNPEFPGSEETYEVALGTEAGSFLNQTSFSAGTVTLDVTWEW